MNRPLFVIAGTGLMLAWACANLTACDRNHTSPTPITSEIQLRDSTPSASSPIPESGSSRLLSSTARSEVAPANATNASNTTRQPYGAAAAVTPSTDGVRPLMAPGVDQRPVDTQLDALVNNQPTAAGIPGGANTAPAATNATNGTNNAAAQRPPLSATELDFVTQASELGLFDVRIAQLAMDRASDSAVKSYASLVATDLVALNNAMRQLAGKLGIPVPASLSEPRQKVLDTLARANQSDFDREFLLAAGPAQKQNLVELFERTGRETRDPVVRNFVLNNLPTLRAHLSAAERLPQRG